VRSARACTAKLIPNSLKGIDYDKLVGTLVQPGATQYGSQNPAAEAERKIAHLIQLRTLVRNLPPLRAALGGCHANLLCKIKSILLDERPDAMRDRIDLTINEDALQGLQKGAFATKNTKVPGPGLFE
jgi:DNA mismatch repair protein MSH4